MKLIQGGEDSVFDRNPVESGYGGLGDRDMGEDTEQIQDRFGLIAATEDGNELVLTRVDTSQGRPPTEMMRFDRVAQVLRIRPRMTRLGEWVEQFDQVSELQLECPGWDSDNHSIESEFTGLVHANGLPAGFSAVYEYGIGVKRAYRGIIDAIEGRTQCTVVRFTEGGAEGPDGTTFRIALGRFLEYVAAVDRNLDRARVAAGRVKDALTHNAVADLFKLERVEPRYGKNPVIRAITEEVHTGQVLDAVDRAALVDEVTAAAPKAAREEPERFGRLRDSVELISLEVLIERFEEGFVGRLAGDEGHWQEFFNTNQFALQQILSMPIVVARQQAHVQSADIDGRGSRITDFLCANTVTRTVFLVEIKTPKTRLVDKSPYRGKGTAAVYPPHRDLSGSVSQLQSQLGAVVKDLSQRLDRSPDLSLDPWNEVRGAVIIGRISELSPEQRDSFLKYRAGLSSVTILGYDEVLARLKSLANVLREP